MASAPAATAACASPTLEMQQIFVRVRTRPPYVMAGLVPAIHEQAPISPGPTRCPEQVRA